MRYVHTNLDGSIGTWAAFPYKAIANGKEYKVHTIRRTKDGTELVGGNNFEEFRVTVGPEDFDVSDMPADHLGIQWVFPTFDEIKAKLHKDTQDKIASVRNTKRGEIIEDRTFRAAWRDNGGKLEVDMPAAREIQRERIRKARAGLLEALDVEYVRADEAGDNAKKRDIATEKQRLRDMTEDPRIDAAQTPDELKVILP